GTGEGLQVGADDRQAIGVLVEAVSRNASQLIQVVLFEVGQQAREPAPAWGTDAAASGTLPLRASIVRVEQVEFAAVAGQRVVHVMVIVAGQGQLLEIVTTGHPGGRFANLLDRGQEQTNQNSNDGNYHQQLDERKRPTTLTLAGLHRDSLPCDKKVESKSRPAMSRTGARDDV